MALFKFPLLLDNDIYCLRSTITVSDIKSHVLPFNKSLVTIRLDCGKVYEYIFAVFSFNEPKTLSGIKPFDSTLIQN
mgnify:FL=1